MSLLAITIQDLRFTSISPPTENSSESVFVNHYDMLSKFPRSIHDSVVTASTFSFVGTFIGFASPGTYNRYKSSIETTTASLYRINSISWIHCCCSLCYLLYWLVGGGEIGFYTFITLSIGFIFTNCFISILGIGLLVKINHWWVLYPNRWCLFWFQEYLQECPSY